jgi:hypothetical protein
VIRAFNTLCVSLLIAQLNYAKCGSEHALKRAPNRPAADLTDAETRAGCTIVSIWPDRHMIEVRCPANPANPTMKELQRYCIDGTTIGAYRKKTSELVNCLKEAEVRK